MFKPAARRPYFRYAATYLALTVGLVWAVCLAYLINYDAAVTTLGELTLSNPIVVLVLHSPALAAIGILLAYDGPRALLNFLRTLIPRRRDWIWLPTLAAIMLAYVFAVRFGCQLVGIPVPADPMTPTAMFVGFVQLLWREVGMVAICVGWFGFFLPLMHKWTRSHIWSGIATGGGIALFVAPGNAFSSFDLAIAWPLYATQLIILSITMSLLLARMKGNVLFFLVPFWVSASGSLWRMYHFAAPTQLVQITLLSLLAVTLYCVVRRSGLPELHTFPEYLEAEYTSRMGAVLPGKGNRSQEVGTLVQAGQRIVAGGAL
ncbi:MAG: hypothetical protein Q4D79_06775 [Propionibacteriaceae bacterium]|nr:hypothetical protein [Propionibacteriaceae bacterium]